MSDLLVPFGFSLADQRIVSIDAVERGLECGCTCPGCGGRLVGVKGNVVVHHFRHYAEDAKCEGARETGLHKFAKQIICEELFVRLPGKGNQVLGPMQNAQKEVWLDGLRPDILAFFPKETVAIEIYVKHRVQIEKVREIYRRQLCTLEIDLSYHRYLGLTEANLREAIINNASRRWIYEPLYIQKAKQQELWRLEGEALIAIAEAKEQARKATAEREEAQRRDDAYREAWRLEEAERLEQLTAVAAELSEQRRAEREVCEREEALRWAEREQHRLDREPPDLQALVIAHGTYDRITPEAWTEFYTRMEVWKDRLRAGELAAIQRS